MVEVFPGDGPGTVVEGKTRQFLLMGIGEFAESFFQRSSEIDLAKSLKEVGNVSYSRNMFQDYSYMPNEGPTYVPLNNAQKEAFFGELGI